MQFITAKSGARYNVAQILKYETFRNGTTQLLLSDGSTHREDFYESFDADFFPVVPAAAGFYEITGFEAHGDYYWRRLPVVAWKVTPSGVFAIPEGITDEDRPVVGIEHPDGTCTDIDGRLCPDLTALKLLYMRENPPEKKIEKAA